MTFLDNLIKDETHMMAFLTEYYLNIRPEKLIKPETEQFQFGLLPIKGGQ